jgi:hypothetical protein
MPVAPLGSMSEPTASVFPSAESATADPNALLVRAFDALTYACWVHEVPVRVKT